MGTTPRAALWACIGYLGLAVLAGGRVPFVELTMFRFAAPDGPTVVPLFLADGEVANIEDYVAFHGVGPAAVEIDHGGYACSVEHKFHEARRYVERHPGASKGPVRIQVGVLILEPGDVHGERRIDAEGSARRR